MATRTSKTTDDQGGRTPDAPVAEVPDGDTPLEVSEISALLEFDPFEKPGGGEPDPEPTATGDPEPGEPGAGEEPPAPTPPAATAPEGGDTPPPPEPTPPPTGGEPTPAPPAGEPDVPPSPAPVDPRDAQIGALTAQLKQQGELLKNLTQAQAPPPAPTAPQPGPPQDDVPAYEFEVPDQLVEGLGAEEPGQRKMAVTALIKGVGQAIHRTVMGSLGEQMRAEVQSQVTSTVANQSSNQNVFDDFYKAFPQLKADHYKSFVQGAVTEVIQENGGQDTWTPLLRDAIGQRALTRIQEAVAQFSQQPPPQPNPGAIPIPPAPPQPPRQLSTGARPTPRAPGGNVADQVGDLLRL